MHRAPCDARKWANASRHTRVGEGRRGLVPGAKLARTCRAPAQQGVCQDGIRRLSARVTVHTANRSPVAHRVLDANVGATRTVAPLCDAWDVSQRCPSNFELPRSSARQPQLGG